MIRREQPPIASGPRVALLWGALATAFIICSGLLVYGSGRGLDLTDEVFYLIWARDPRAYTLTYQPFGYLLHPLFALVGGRLQAFRLTGFAIAASAGAYLGYSLAPPGRRCLFATQGALAGLTIFFPWIITPSYNSAANSGAMLIVAGLLSISKKPMLPVLVAILALAAGNCVAAFSKPPLLAISLTVILASVVLTKNVRTQLALAAAVALGTALMFLFIAPTELIELVWRILATQHELALPNTPFALPGKLAGEWRTVPVPLSLAAVAAGATWALRRFNWSKWLGYAAVALSFFYLADCTADAIDGEVPYFLGLALILASAGYAGLLGTADRPCLPHVALLLGAPLAIALGTFNNFWSQLNFSLGFPFIALFAFASSDPVPWRKAVALTVSIAGPVAAMLLAAQYPYSLPAPIFEQRISVEPPIARGPILVDKETADFISSADGLASGAVLIDLSGTGPGVAAVLRARAPVVESCHSKLAGRRLEPTDRRRAPACLVYRPSLAGVCPNGTRQMAVNP
ncbi:MAG: hypothetical protein NVS3B5_06570 [Sphingomicrobium sp.]